MSSKWKVFTVISALITVPSLAFAQQPQGDTTTDVYDSDDTTTHVQSPHQVTVGEGAPSTALPPPQDDHDAQPSPAAPSLPVGGVTEQAGVGGTQSYARAGVLEFGGSVGFSRASGFTQVNVSPSIGWFFMDNVEISGIVGMNYINADGESSAFLTVLAEPSLHIPFSNTLFGFIGGGIGLGYSDETGAGLALAPRVGMNILIGRSGILTPALQMVYSTTEAIQTSQGTLLAVNTSFGANMGFTVMW